MEVDRVSGSEPQEEDLGDVDEVRRVSLCYNFGMMGHFAGACSSSLLGYPRSTHEVMASHPCWHMQDRVQSWPLQMRLWM